MRQRPGPRAGLVTQRREYLKMDTKLSSRTLAGAIGVSGGTGATLPLLAQGTTNYAHGPGMMGNAGWAGWFIGPIMMLLFLAAAVTIVVLLVRWLGGTDHHRGPSTHRSGSSALEILEQRFARGEIDEEEFRKRKQALSE